MKIYSCNICGLIYDGPLTKSGGGCFKLAYHNPNSDDNNPIIYDYDLCFDCAQDIEATIRERAYEQHNK